jgi:uncharacterized protein (TIGR00730 family)
MQARLVYGGGRAGLMGTIADAALAGGADVLGVIPRRLMARELGHPGVQELRVVDTMHDRKLAMAKAAHAFVALPGGLGTLEELFEAWTWRQLGYHDRPIGVLDVAGYWAPLRSLVAHAIDEGFVDASELQRLVVDDDPARLLHRLRDSTPTHGARADWSPI